MYDVYITPSQDAGSTIVSIYQFFLQGSPSTYTDYSFFFWDPSTDQGFDDLATATLASITAYATLKSYTIGNIIDLSKAPVVTGTFSQATPSDPTGTTNATGVMMGLAASITPTKTGNVMIVVSGNIANATAGDGAQTQIRYGTGTAPSNGAALTGSAVGNLAKIVNAFLALLAPGSGNFTCNAVVSGLNVGTTYWIDQSLAHITGGTATITSVSVSVIEI